MSFLFVTMLTVKMEKFRLLMARKKMKSNLKMSVIINSCSESNLTAIANIEISQRENVDIFWFADWNCRRICSHFDGRGYDISLLRTL